jgi:glycosyltransferase involved in cell wall biosynthesis/ribosomal protein S18 acetylase RimI-like enzyme
MVRRLVDMKIAHLTTVDMSLRYLVLPQLEAALEYGEALGISAPGSYVPEIESRGIRHISLESSTRGMSILSDLRAARQLWRVLSEEDIEILHTHNPKPGLYGRVVGRLTGVPIVVNTVHGLYATEDSPLLKRTVVYLAEFVASRFSDMELIQSPEDFSLMESLHLTPPQRTRLLGNGVDLARFNPGSAAAHRDAVRAELGVTDAQILVGMVGRLVDEKGVPELVEAAQRLGDHYVIAIVGPHDPDKDDAVSAKTIELGEEAGVRFLGMRSDVDRLYASFDVFVLPSHREGFPRAAMEAAASGLPIIATDIRGCRQVVDEGVNGYLFPVRDAAALARLIERIGSDQSLRNAMGGASAQKALREFDERRVVERVMTAYRDVAADKGLAWQFDSSPEQLLVEGAMPGDISAVARLHERMITTGFLSSLGARFLRVLYNAILKDPASALYVVRDSETVMGFISGTTDTGAFYRRFAFRHLLPAAWALMPVLLRASVWKRIYESFRYGGGGSPVPAELLSMAVAPAARRRGLGRCLVETLLEWVERGGLASVKVVVGADNETAVAFYRDCGFGDAVEINVHGTEKSWELVWSA